MCHHSWYRLAKAKALWLPCLVWTLSMSLTQKLIAQTVQHKNQHHRKGNTVKRFNFVYKQKLLSIDSLPDSAFLHYPSTVACKGYLINRLFPGFDSITGFSNRNNSFQPVATRKFPLAIKGNVMYDVYYRSNIDTPYAQQDVYQHTIQTYVDITWKDNYPFRLYLTNRFGNSPLFRKYTDLNLQFNPQDFAQKIKAILIEKAINSIQNDSLYRTIQMLEEKRKELAALQNKVNDPGILQKMIEAKERSMLVDKIGSLTEKYTKNDSSNYKDVLGLLKSSNFKFPNKLPGDSLKQKLQTDTLAEKLHAYVATYEKNKRKVDSLQRLVKKLDSAYQKYAALARKNSADLKNEIESLRSNAAIKEEIHKLHIADSALPQGFKPLLALKTLGIGRSIADYSELSAKNISINGVQAEYNPHYYYAVAAGFIDYRFRNYLLQTPNLPKQYLALARFGKGDKDDTHIIGTYYTGRRQLYYSNSLTQNNAIPNYNLMGFTIEARYNLNKNIFITAEFAKSSQPYYRADNAKSANLFSNMVKMNERSNEAYALGLKSYFPATQTTVTGSYRHSGANFQSFSIFSNGSEQTAWSVKADQPLFKRRLIIMAAIRKNDFVSALTNIPYKSDAVFKSFQATLRMKKWPVLSIGYFPASQIIKTSDVSYSESLFYTLTASASHFYKWQHASFNTTILYTQFYNRASDTGFVYFNSRNFLISHAVFVGKISLQSNFSLATNTSYNLYMLEQNITYRINKWLSLGGGLKYNKQTIINNTLWGYAGNARLNIPYVGEIQLMADKGFIPGSNRQLVENNTGRLTYFKIF